MAGFNKAVSLSQTLVEELIKKGHRADRALPPHIAQELDNIANKIGQDPSINLGSLSRGETATIRNVTESLLGSMKKDGVFTRASLYDLQDAFGKSLVTKFGDNEQSKVALQAFRDSVSAVWTQSRAAARGTTAEAAAPSVARVDKGITTVVDNVTAEAGLLAKVRGGAMSDINAVTRGIAPADIVRKEAAIRSDIGTILKPEKNLTDAERAKIIDLAVDRAKNPGRELTPEATTRTTPRTSPPPIETAKPVAASPTPAPAPTAAAPTPAAQAADIPLSRSGGDNIHTDSARALKEAETLAKKISDEHSYVTGWQTSLEKARNTFFDKMSDVNSPDIAKRQSALEALTGNLPGKDGVPGPAIHATGYRVSTGTPEAAKVQEYLSDPVKRMATLKEVYPGKPETELAQLIGKQRTVEEIEHIFKSKPGVDGAVIQNQARSLDDRIAALVKIDPKNQLTQGEWETYTRHVKLGVLELQQKEVMNAVDKSRLAGGVVDEAHFTNLRQIMRDPDYLAKHPLEGNALQAQQSGRPRSADQIEADLRSGKTIGDTEITSLNVKYNRPDKAVIDGLALRAASSDAKTFLEPKEVNEFRTKLAQNGLLSADAGRTPQLNKSNFAQHLRDGNPITEGDFDKLVAKEQTAKRPWLINIPKVGQTEWPRWARTAAIGSVLGYLGVIDIPFAGGEHMDGGAAGVVYRTAGQMTGGKTLFMPDGSVIDADVKQKVSQANSESMAKQSVYAGQAIGQSWAKGFEGRLRGEAPSSSVPAAASAAPSSTEKGVQVTQASYVLAELQAGYGLISESEMTNLANTIATKAKSGDAGVLTSKEYAEVRQDSAYTGLHRTAQQKLDELLAPGLKP
jgi:hypothetical protein